MALSIFRRLLIYLDEDHTRRDFPPAPFRCDYCPKNFGTADLLHDHRLERHGWLFDQLRNGGIS